MWEATDFTIRKNTVTGNNTFGVAIIANPEAREDPRVFDQILMETRSARISWLITGGSHRRHFPARMIL